MAINENMEIETPFPMSFRLWRIGLGNEYIAIVAEADTIDEIVSVKRRADWRYQITCRGFAVHDDLSSLANRQDAADDPGDNAIVVLRFFGEQSAGIGFVLTLDRLRLSIRRARKTDVELRDGAERGSSRGWFERTPDGGLRLLEPGCAKLAAMVGAKPP